MLRERLELPQRFNREPAVPEEDTMTDTYTSPDATVHNIHTGYLAKLLDVEGLYYSRLHNCYGAHYLTCTKTCKDGVKRRIESQWNDISEMYLLDVSHKDPEGVDVTERNGMYPWADDIVDVWREFIES